MELAVFESRWICSVEWLLRIETSCVGRSNPSRATTFFGGGDVLKRMDAMDGMNPVAIP